MPTPLPTLQNVEDLPIPEQLLSSVTGRNGRAVVIFAIGMGYTGIAGKEHSLMAPDGTRVNLPMHGDMNFKVFRSKINTIVTHTETPIVSPLSLVEIIALGLKLDPDHLRVLRVGIDHFQKRVSSVVHPPPSSAAEEGEVAPVVIPPLTRDLIKEEPWTAHGRSRPNQGTETYPSDAVMERLWEDDTTDYACRWPGCNYVRTNPRSVAAHFTSHVRGQGKAPQPEGDGVDVEWTPKQITRIRRLKRELDGALSAALAAGIDITDTQWIAEWIINHRIEDLEHGDTGESEDDSWTAEQILDKIAALADRGRAHVLREQIVTLNDLLDRSESARQKVEGNLHALRDLINETDS